MLKQNRQFLIEWNNTFPLDRWYRKKYNIPFGSKQHLETSQIDIYLEWLEDQLFEEHEENMKLIIEKEKKYKEGEWITQRVGGEEEDDLFDKINL